MTSHEDVPISQVADQSSTTTYISPNVAHSLNPVPTSSSAPDVSAASGNNHFEELKEVEFSFAKVYFTVVCLTRNTRNMHGSLFNNCL